MILDVGTPIYWASKCISGRLIIETLWVIGYSGSWINLGYANHPDAFKCNHRSQKDVARIYSATPEEAYEKYRDRKEQEATRLTKKGNDMLCKADEVLAKLEQLTFQDFKVEVQEYDTLDAIF